MMTNLAQALDDRLSEENVRAVACPDGRVVGYENEVRVFEVQHIKGLEFEAVFFVGIDVLAAQEPELFDRFLYVGATRAATYLGITCQQELPSPLETLRTSFAESW